MSKLTTFFNNTPPIYQQFPIFYDFTPFYGSTTLKNKKRGPEKSSPLTEKFNSLITGTG